MRHIKLFESYFDKSDEFKGVLQSDLMRMEIIDNFFKKSNIDNSYNRHEPSNFKLIDDWDGYDDQVYVQSTDNGIVYWEGWVPECWKAIYLKEEYKGLSKEEVLESFMTNRFPIIASEFNLIIKEYTYFKYRGKYILKVSM